MWWRIWTDSRREYGHRGLGQRAKTTATMGPIQIPESSIGYFVPLGGTSRGES